MPPGFIRTGLAGCGYPQPWPLMVSGSGGPVRAGFGRMRPFSHGFGPSVGSGHLSFLFPIELAGRIHQCGRFSENPG